MVKINEYIISIPDDFESTLKALANKFRFSLACLIMEEGPLSFTDLTQRTIKDKSYIVNHLKKLELNGLVQNFLHRKEGTNEYSFYEITEYGKKIITDLIKSYNNYHEKVSDEWQIDFKNF